MRIAFFSPLPPSKSGIADYAAALLPELRSRADVTVFTEHPQQFDPSEFDALLYQMGNNHFHMFTYELALAYPGVVVMHESNLHHLVADLTIKRGNWDAYLRELEYDSGPEALAYGQRVRRLEVGPDYSGVPMLRRLLEHSRGAIAHSHCVEQDLQRAGFTGPIGVIPHGAWLVEPERMRFRDKLGLDETTPLVGIFGFLKPYKRVAEALRAFRRLVRVQPAAKMILVGEPHPELRLPGLLQTLDLYEHVRVLGFQEIDEFNGYLGACDIILNLRFPTVGESSGTLLRALGMGKAVIVSDIGSFREYPDEICLKAPVGPSEEDVLFEYLSLLTSRPDLAKSMGTRARGWVERNCNWGHVAEQYLNFLRAVAAGTPWEKPEPAIVTQVAAEEAPPAREDEPAESETEEYLKTWAPPNPEAQAYLSTHLTRLGRTVELIPPGGPDDRILEMGAYLQITPALHTRLGYGEVRGCYYGAQGRTDRRRAVSQTGEEFEVDVDHFDAEKHRFPYPDEHFSTVVCGELIEHLFHDPMFLMSEVNRILRPGGHLLLTTPNICSHRALTAILLGYHPGFFPAYIKPAEDGEETEARHNREYAPREIADLFRDAGFEVTRLETGPFREEPHPEFAWVQHLLKHYHLPQEHRGDGIYALGRKTGPVRERYPAWLYSTGG